MGGAREFNMPSKAQDQVVGNLRIHESSGEIHFHDDKNRLKAAVPSADMFDKWQKLTSGQKSKIKFRDKQNNTELRVRVVGGKNKPTDVQIEVCPIAGSVTNDFAKFDKFMKG